MVKLRNKEDYEMMASGVVSNPLSPEFKRIPQVSRSRRIRPAKLLMTLLGFTQSQARNTKNSQDFCDVGMTLEQALQFHLDEKPHRPRTIDGYKYHLNQYFNHLKTTPVSKISRQMVRQHFLYLKSNHGETTAASTMRTLKAVINTAMKIDESLSSNPVSALYIPTPRRRKVAMLHLKEWWQLVQKISPVRRDLHITMLLTGARRSSILQVKRTDVDVENAILTLTHMKTSDEPMKLPIGPFLAKLLANRMKEDETLANPWLWPSSTSISGRVMEPRAPSLPSPHEYRHHARTLYIAAGVPYAQSALLLGHKLPGATGAYIHAEHLVEHLRPHAEVFEEFILTEISSARGAADVRNVGRGRIR